MITALALAPSGAALSLAVPLALSAAVFGLVLADRERTTLGEIMVATTLSAWAFPVALMAGATVSVATAAWLVWAVAFIVSTVAVRAVIERRKTQAPAWGAAAVSLAVGGAAIATAIAAPLAPGVSLALLPVCAVSCFVSVAPPHPRHLRAVGWGLVAACLATAIALVAA